MGDEKVTALHGRAARLEEEWQGKRSFPCVWVDDAQAQVVGSSYVIKGLLDELGLGLIYGPTGCGKTFLTIDIAWSVAAGMPWRGRRVKGGLVVYTAAEAGASILRRFSAWRERRIVESREERIPVVVITRAANLLDETEVAELMGALERISEEARLPLRLVIFDTLSRSIPGGDENSSHDMTAVVAVADRMRAELKASTLFVHHSGKDASKGARGHSALFAAADMVLSVVDRVATVEKVRDGIAGERFGFDLKVVDLGTDEDGDPIATCIVGPGEQISRSKPPKLTSTENVALQALKEVLLQSGEIRAGTSVLPAGIKSARLEAWQMRFRARLGETRETNSNAARQSFFRAKTGLASKKVCGLWEEFAWIW
jgi:KaiC/GvpD/RAD55 family RecA-like ATPase